MNDPVSRDGNVMGGELCFAGTRVQVATLFAYLRSGSIEQFLSDYPSVTREAAAAVIEHWMSPLPPGLPIGAVVYHTHVRTDGGRVTYASVVNGSYSVGRGWHYDFHGLDNGAPAHPGQPLGPSCRPGEMFES
jgi:uncharacterized protein (DUF433 family)